MNGLLKTVLSMSLSGALLILVLFAAKPWLKNRLSRSWQYYIWLVVIARLLLPLTPERSAVGLLFQRMDQAVGQTAVLPLPEGRQAAEGLPAAGGPLPREDRAAESAALSLEDPAAAVQRFLPSVWLAAALLLLLRKITVYQSFVRYIHAGCTEISDVALLDRLAQAGERAGVKRPVELYENGLISSPLLLGLFRPCIVLPSASLPEADFMYIVQHELTHCKRRDLFYKWLIQLTICLHWFNPLVWLMGRELRQACELACDEAVIGPLPPEGRRAYGDALLRAAGAGGRYQNSIASVTLHESAELLKERLCAIMRFKKNSRLTAVLSFVLAGALTAGAAAAGAYPGPAKAGAAPSAKGGTYTSNAPKSTGGSIASQAERYYQAGSLPLFQIVFSRLSEKEQRAWLNRIYEDGETAFFNVSLDYLGMDSPLAAELAERFYADGAIDFFSVLANHMSETALEAWLDKALDDGRIDFQSMLFNQLDKNDEWDEKLDSMEKEWEEKQLKEYQAAGVAMKGKNYYYQGQLVNIFLDMRPNRSFYTLSFNPAGTVNIRIVRNQEGKITGAAYMTEEEIVGLLGGEIIDIPVEAAAVRNGEYLWLGSYSLSEGDEIYYNLSAEGGDRLDVGFARPGQTVPDTRYYQVSCRREHGKLEVQSGPMVWTDPLKPGLYRLFLHTEGGVLTNVKGSVSIFRADQDGG